ncbi:MAG: hypothetical protein J6O01_05325, partial [Bacteroidales bacterium]|nr:hypothetical protein [Bacteroidales bacterium]
MMIPSLRAWICAVLLLCMLPAAAQQHRSAAAVAALEANIDRAGGNTHAYEFAPLHDTKPPKGFKPFYISHYGRHGSRSDWSGPYYRELIRILEEAGRIGILTPEGDSLLAETRLVNDAHAGMDGRLSQRGVREHAQLAERMYRRYPEVFRKGSTHVRSISSIGQRCLISMAAFTTRLDECAGGRLDFYWDNGETFQYVVSNDASKETRQKSQRLIDSLDRSFIQDSVQIKERLFTNPVEARKLIPDIFVFE